MARLRMRTPALLCLVACGTAQARDARPVPPASAAAELRKPWPDAATLRERRRASEQRPLFETSDTLAFTLSADFGRVNKDRNPARTQRYPGVLTVAGRDGQPRSIPVTLRPRGHFRRMERHCSFVPLRVEFGPEEEIQGTPFEGQRALKLVTHCSDAEGYEQDRLKEYLAYRVLNVLTPRSFRARLARVTYSSSATGRPIATRHAIFVEADRDVARRLEGRIVDVEKTLFRHLHAETLDVMMLFQYMIGNTDFSIHALHNVRLVQDRAGLLHPIPYDLDFSGLVNAPYAKPDPRMGLLSVRSRRYRGPCRTAEAWEPHLALFRARKPEVMALADSIEGIERDAREDARAYLEQFYSTIERPDAVRKHIIESCTRNKAGM